jgi:peptidyl-prolyl cis-trans isomerase C
LNKQTIFRYVLAAGVATAVSVPLIIQVKNARSAAHQAAEQVAEAQTAQAKLDAAAPATMPAPVDPAKVILTQGDVTLTAGEFGAIVASLPANYQAALSDPTVKKRLADRIVQVKQLAEEARKRGLQDKPELKQQIEMQTNELLANALMKDVQGGGNEKEQREYFDANKSNFDNVKARHILIRTPGSPVPVAGTKELTDAEAKAKAEQIVQRLAKGEDFAAIAKAESDDKGSGVQGGDLGTFAPYKMDSTFSKATLGLKKNEISAPVKTQFGYHIIQLLDDTPRTYEEAKGDIGEARWGQVINSLKDKGKPEYDPAFFGEATPTTQPASALLPAVQ